MVTPMLAVIDKIIMRKLKLVLKWALGMFLFLVFLVEITKAPIAGIIALTLGLFILPPLEKILSSKIQLSRGVKWGVLIIGIFVMGIFLPKPAPKEQKAIIAEETQPTLNVEINITHRLSGNAIYFDILTNLPDNFIGNFTVTDDTGRIMGQSSYKVNKGTVTSEAFTSKGQKYPIGEYTLSVSSPLPRYQEDDNVKKMIGLTGEYLKGSSIIRQYSEIFEGTFSTLNIDYKFVIK
jgi:hypothetical protein